MYPEDDEEIVDLTEGMPPPPFAITSRDELVRSLIAATERLNAGQGIRVDAEYRAKKKQMIVDRFGDDTF